MPETRDARIREGLLAAARRTRRRAALEELEARGAELSPDERDELQRARSGDAQAADGTLA